MNGLRFLFCALLLLAGCRPDTPEARLRKTFDTAVKAIQEGDARSAAEVLSPGFAGPDGMTREEASLYLAGLLREEKVSVVVLSNRLEVQGPQGVQSVDVVLAGRSGLLPRDASRKTFLLRWEILEGRWRLRSLREG